MPQWVLAHSRLPVVQTTYHIKYSNVKDVVSLFWLQKFVEKYPEIEIYWLWEDPEEKKKNGVEQKKPVPAAKKSRLEEPIRFTRGFR